MKKNELKQGVAYWVASNNRSIWTYRDSYFEIAQTNREHRYYVVFEGDEPRTPYRSPSSVYVTRCKTYGYDCPTHSDESGRLRCPSIDYRLMDIKDEFWKVVKRLRDNRIKEKNAKDIRAERLVRIAKRQQKATRDEVSQEFFKAINATLGEQKVSWGGVREWTKFGELSIDQMKALTDALKASQPAQEEVA